MVAGDKLLNCKVKKKGTLLFFLPLCSAFRVLRRPSFKKGQLRRLIVTPRRLYVRSSRGKASWNGVLQRLPSFVEVTLLKNPIGCLTVTSLTTLAEKHCKKVWQKDVQQFHGLFRMTMCLPFEYGEFGYFNDFRCEIKMAFQMLQPLFLVRLTAYLSFLNFFHSFFRCNYLPYFNAIFSVSEIIKNEQKGFTKTTRCQIRKRG